MSKISDGSDSTLGTYRKIALALSGNNPESKAVKFFDDYIAKSPNGENEEVIQHETQMLLLIGTLLGNSTNRGEPSMLGGK